LTTLAADARIRPLKRGIAMTDEEFLALDRVGVRAALADIKDEGERRRLAVLYVRAHPSTLPGQAARGVSPPMSGMLEWGRVLFWVGVIGVVISIVVWANRDANVAGLGDLLFAGAGLYIASALMGLGGFMWMLGAIEQRLIEIRGLLQNNPLG
jgi:hypothetical protein